MWDLSSPTRDWTHALALEAQSPNHWTAREVPVLAWDFDASVCCFHLGDVDKWRNTERALNLMPLQSNRSTLLLDSSASAEFSQQAKPSKAQGLEANSMPAKSLQSCPMLCDLMDCSPPGSSVHGILQARILEGVALPSSLGSSQPRDQTLLHLLLNLLHWQAGSLPLAPPGKPPPGTNWQQFPNCGTVRPSSRQEERLWKKKRILSRRRRETT